MLSFEHKGIEHKIEKLSNISYNPFGQGVILTDKFYRIYNNNSGYLPDTFNASGYGFATVFKIPLMYQSQLEENIHIFLENVQQDLPLNTNLKVNQSTPELKFTIENIDLAIILKKTKTHLWGFVLDSQANYLSYHFLLTNIYDFKNKSMNMFEDEMIIQNKKQDIFWASGDENTDQEFSMWIQQECPKQEKELIKMGIITHFE